MKSGLFPALLKHWRHTRGLSQLDLSLAADVSSRHISFLETGRATPSQTMVLGLANALQVPLREQNRMLIAAGFKSRFPEPPVEEVLDDTMGKVIQLMLENHDPYPMVVMDWTFNLLNLNRSAALFFSGFIPNLFAGGQRINVFEAIFDPDMARPFIQDWHTVARKFLSSLHRMALLNAHDDRLQQLIDKVLSYPDVPEQWRHPDLSEGAEPALALHLKKGDLELGVITTQVNFNAPQNVTLEELRIESYLPLDAETDAFFQNLL